MAKSALAFKRVQALPLPNGETVEARKPNISRLIMETGVEAPSILREQVVIGLKSTLKGEQQNGSSPDDVIDTLIANLPSLSSFMDLVIRHTLVWPKIADGEPNYENGEIGLYDLSEDARLILVRFALTEETSAITDPPKETITKKSE